MKLSKKTQATSLKAELLCTLSHIYVGLGKYDKAVEAAKETLAISDPNLDEDFRLEICNLLRKAYLGMGDNANAERQTKNIRKILNRLDLNEYSVSDPELFNDMAELESARGNYKMANRYLRLYADRNLKILLKEKNGRVNELQAKFDLTDKNLQLKSLTIQQQKDKLEIAGQRNKVTIIGAILALTAVTTALLYRAARSHKKNNRMLKEKNEVIRATLDERNLLLREIHHRVKNNLQLVISLLSIQARENEHDTVDEFLDKGSNRIISMALIHQSLYEADNLAKVNFREYLERLVDAAMEGFGRDGQTLDLDVHTDEVRFDIQTSIPLGLIVNELLCNAMKYAFGNSKEGKITIRITKLDDGGYNLHFSDNGRGFSGSKKGKSFGMELIRLLTKQLKGRLSVSNEEGMAYDISFEDKVAEAA